MSQNTCTRCNRALKDPQSVKRGMGPICYRESGGGIFEADMEADEKEWARRDELLRHGGEVDFGVNWQYPIEGNVLPTFYTLRVSVRFKDENFEAYGIVTGPGKNEEVIFTSTPDIKAAYRAAIDAGPRCSAEAFQARKQGARETRKMMRKVGQIEQYALRGVKGQAHQAMTIPKGP